MDDLDTFKERVIFAIFGIAALGGTASWTALHLAGLLTTGHVPHVSVGEALAIATRVLIHPLHPIPEALQPQLPSTLSYYIALLALLALAIGLTALILTETRTGLDAIWTRVRTVAAPIAERERRRRERGARWAQRKDLRSLIVHKPTRGRLTLGRTGGRLLATEHLHSVLIAGPTGSMKTTGFAIPALLEWDGPVVCTSVKTDLLEDTIRRRRQLGDVMIYDPSGTTREVGAQWTPLAGCGNWSVALRRANTICTVAGTNGSHGMDFWYQNAAKLLAILFYAAATSDRTMRDVMRWVNTQERNEVYAAIQETELDLAAQAWRAQIVRDEKQRSSIYTTAQTALAAFDDEQILASAQHAEITAREMLNGQANTLYLIAPVNEQKHLRVLFAALLDEIRGEAYAQAARGPLVAPLLFVLDELANIAPIPELDTLASTARGQDIQLVTIVQDFAQLHSRYGRDAAETIINNHKAKLVLSGIADPTTLQWVTRVAGDEELPQVSRTAGAGARESTTQSSVFRALAPPNLVRQQASEHGLLIYGHLPPATIELRPWFGDGGLSYLVHATESKVRQ